MMVLRAATAVGEEAVEVWTAFVEKLGNGVSWALMFKLEFKVGILKKNVNSMM